MFTKKTVFAFLTCFFFTHNISTSDNDFQATETPLEGAQNLKKSNRIPVALTTCLLIITGLTVHQAYAASSNQEKHLNDVDTCQQNIAQLQQDITQSKEKENELTIKIKQLDERFNYLGDSIGAWAMDLQWEIRYADQHAQDQREMYRQRIQEKQKQLQRITKQCESKYQIQKTSKSHHQKSR